MSDGSGAIRPTAEVESGIDRETYDIAISEHTLSCFLDFWTDKPFPPNIFSEIRRN
ncbi:hypothetical protein GSbR_42590 [Geobacter sp. SVR]|nr:hypothetical protein GSbR_42590 [Geobacter sp. SVR]